MKGRFAQEPSNQEISPAHGDPTPSKIRFQIRDGDLSKVEQRGRQNCICMSSRESVIEMLHCTGAAGSDHRDIDTIGHRPRQFQIVAVFDAVAIHAGEQNLPRPQIDCLFRPFDGIQTRIDPAAV